MHILRSLDGLGEAFGGMLMVWSEGGCGFIGMDGGRGVNAGVWIIGHWGISA